MIERSSRIGMNSSAGESSLNGCVVESGLVSFDTELMSTGARIV